jgi:hypothetical protein
MRRWTALAVAAAVLGGGCSRGVPQAATPTPSGPPLPPASSRCTDGVHALRYFDGLDKASVSGATIGGLSALAYVEDTTSYVMLTDRNGSEPSRLWSVTDPASPRLTGSIVLRKADGTPYTGEGLDAEGLVRLGDGRLMVSSEYEPSIRIFDAAGTEVGSVAVPERFRVAPAGEATENATLESLAVTPDGRFLYTTTEGALKGDTSAAGANRWRRLQIYERGGDGGYRPVRQVGYETTAGHRVADAVAYAPDRLLVLEQAYEEGIGHTPKLYAVSDPNAAPDVTGVPNLSTVPPASLVTKRLVADLTKCPTLGARTGYAQTNQLMESYEGMSVRLPHGRGRAMVELISDDNFAKEQVTRLLTLEVALP